MNPPSSTDVLTHIPCSCIFPSRCSSSYRLQRQNYRSSRRHSRSVKQADQVWWTNSVMPSSIRMPDVDTTSPSAGRRTSTNLSWPPSVSLPLHTAICTLSAYFQFHASVPQQTFVCAAVVPTSCVMSFTGLHCVYGAHDLDGDGGCDEQSRTHALVVLAIQCQR